jgi:hypothetical protein
MAIYLVRKKTCNCINQCLGTSQLMLLCDCYGGSTGLLVHPKSVSTSVSCRFLYFFVPFLFPVKFHISAYTNLMELADRSPAFEHTAQKITVDCLSVGILWL